MALTRTEIMDYVLLQSGQFFDGLSHTLLRTSHIDSIIKKNLALYSKFRPVKKIESFTLFNGKVFDGEDGKGIPRNIIEIRRVISGTSFHVQFPFSGSLVVPRTPYWRYQAPTLEFRYPCDYYEVTYNILHEYKVPDDNTDINADPVIHDASLRDTTLLDLITGNFMMILGSSRESYVVNGIPVEVNTGYLINEGKELYESAKESLKEGASFYHAVHP